jgi:hypothetical protein
MNKSIILFPIIFLIKISLSFGQNINKKLQDNFNHSLQYLPEYQRDTNNIYFKQGIALLIGSHVDTLNLEDLRVEISDYKILEIEIDEKSGTFKEKKIEGSTAYKPISPVYPSFFFCECKNRNDSLIVRIYTGFKSFGGNETIITKSKAKSTFFQSSNGGEYFKIRGEDALTSEISIPSETITIELNDNEYANEKNIFGLLELITNPYYQKDEYRFINGFLYSNVTLKYLFKCRPNYDFIAEIQKMDLETTDKRKMKKMKNKR